MSRFFFEDMVASAPNFFIFRRVPVRVYEDKSGEFSFASSSCFSYMVGGHRI